MKKRTIALIFTGILATVIFTGCGSDTGSKESAATPTQEEAADAIDVVIHASNWKFDQEVYEVPVGSTVKLVLDNTDGYHEVGIKGLGINVKAKEPKVFKVEKAGEYEIFCSIVCGNGHADMKAKLVVKE